MMWIGDVCVCLSVGTCYGFRDVCFNITWNIMSLKSNISCGFVCLRQDLTIWVPLLKRFHLWHAFDRI